MSSNNPGTPKLWARLTIAGCAVALIADLILWATGHWHGKLFPGLYAVIGFASYCAIVYGAMAWRKVVMRAEDYYEDVPAPYTPPEDAP